VGDVAGLTEVAVRVSKAATSELVYFGLPTVKTGAGVCKCGADCKCASGDKSNCKCGAECKCGADCPMRQAKPGKGCGGGCGGGK